MTDILSALSSELASAAETAANSVVQLQGHRRLVAGVAIDAELVVATDVAVHDGAVAVRSGDGRAFDGAVLGRSAATGLTVLRVTGLGAPVPATAAMPRPGSLALAVGRTWSGNVYTALAPIAVVGGPLRTGRSSELAEVIRIGVAPHGALAGGALVDGMGRLLGVVTSMAIRGTTVTVPIALAMTAARDVVAGGGARQGYLGVSSVPVSLAPRQRVDGRAGGLLVTGVVDGGPAERAGVLVGDVLIAFDGQPIADADDLLTRLRSERPDQKRSLGLLRGDRLETLSVAVSERPRA